MNVVSFMFDAPRTLRSCSRSAPAPQGSRVSWTPRHWVVAGEADRIALLDLETLEVDVEIASPRGEYVTAMDLSPDGHRIAVSTRGGWLGIFDLESRELAASWKAHDNVGFRVAYLDMDRIASAGGDGRDRVWSESGDLQTSSESFRYAIVFVAETESTNRLFIGPMFGIPLVLDARSGKTLLELSGMDPNAILTRAVRLSGDRFVTADSTGALRLWTADVQER